MSNIKCPTCGGDLIYHRRDDGEVKVYVRNQPDSEDYETEEIENESNGSTNVYCSVDDTHEISVDLWDKVVCIAEDFGY